MSRGIIVLDAGHGQFGNRYPLLENTYEGTQNFKLAAKLKAELEDTMTMCGAHSLAEITRDMVSKF